MTWPVCMTVSLLLLGRQATLAQPLMVPAALEVYSDAAPPCGVSYLVLRAAVDASCGQLCQLTLAETRTPSTGLHNTEDAEDHSASPESQLLSSNVISHVQSIPRRHICCKRGVTQAATAGQTLLPGTSRRHFQGYMLLLNTTRKLP